MHERQGVRFLIARVRARWRGLVFLQAAARAALAATGVLALALAAAPLVAGMPLALAGTGAVAAVAALAAVVWGLWPARQTPADARVARFIEEREPSLDDRLASAVGLSADAGRSALAAPMLADASKRADAVDPRNIIPATTLQRAALHAAGAALLLGSVVYLGRDTALQSFDAAAISLFPSRLVLEVSPGNARVSAGSPLAIQARLPGNRAPVVARVLRGEEDPWQPSDMTAADPSTFILALGPLSESFKYRVVAGALSSPVFTVEVVRQPRVARIDLEYRFPPRLGLQPRTEHDSGDIYAPAGTVVDIHVHTEGDPASGHMSLGEGKHVALTSQSGSTLSGSLTVEGDGSYRITLADGGGRTHTGETEYFIRTLEDRPPEVRVVRPARDRSVTRLEEVEVQAEAVDDFGIERLDLVYAVRGGGEKVVPLDIPRRATSVDGAHTLYLEDMDVEVGDFVSYYVRARDTARGRRSSEARSDIFFLEVKPFEQGFTLAQSQAGGGGQNRELDDLVTTQKEIIVATWKLDRRGQTANAKSAQDIRAVAQAETELKTRVEETASSFRESNLRDPRRVPGRPQAGGRRAGQSLPEDEAMTAAARALGRAADALNQLNTSAALAPEMEALNHLLKAQGDLRTRQVTRQQAGSGGGANRAEQDLSGLFDRELQRQQQTNYETPTTTESRRDTAGEAVDKIKELARRQDELLGQQRDLAAARDQMTAEQLKRELERLTREQSELRQRAEDIARQMASRQNGSGRQNQSGQNQPGQPSRGQNGSSGSSGSNPVNGANSGSSQQLREAAAEMQGAASELRRDDPARAGERASRALAKLQQAARQAQAATPDEQRRALGDMQLEARQLADAQRQVASELGRGQQGAAAPDNVRRLAGEQQRLTDRARRLQGRMNESASAAPGAGELARQRVPERMQQSADELGSMPEGSAAPQAGARAQEDIARALDRTADALAAATGASDGESRRLSEQLARAQDARERMERLGRDMERLGRPGGLPASSSQPATGRSGAQETSSELAALREQYTRDMQEARQLLDQLRREDRTLMEGGAGVTFEGQGMTLSAPGTEAFKQDFARWEQLRKQATIALDAAASVISQKLAAIQQRDRLAAGLEDKPPASYQQQVDDYFKAIAGKKQP